MHGFEPPKDVEFDRLVDGALTEDEERAFLARLDDTPDGWRRLALAFCEDRALRRALSGFGDEPAESPARVERRTRLLEPRVPSWIAPVVVGVLAMTVGLLAGFGWGRGTADDRFPERDVPSVADEGFDEHSLDPVVDREDGEETIEFLVHDGATLQRVRVPIVSTDEADPAWMDVERPVLPESVRRVFEAEGHEVAEGRRFLRVPLDADRDALVPVGHFSVQRVEYQ